MVKAISALPISEAEISVDAHYLDALRKAGFQGEIAQGDDSRIVFSTDNSIYRQPPRAILFPIDENDVALAMRIAGQAAFRTVTFAPRGGGTGTNGQSLTNGIVLDLSRHMNAILEINVAERWARVQPGVVKDQLNAALKPHGLFFAPELSTSNRATIGGMVSTDASGQGSCTYGKTRDHVLALKTALLGGDVLTTHPVAASALEATYPQSSRAGQIAHALHRLATENQDLIEEIFPPLNRCLTGYDLKHLMPGDGIFDPNSVLCGAEGTLGVVVEIKLNLLPVPKHVTLINVRYESFMDALRDARHLMAKKPISIETVDSRVLDLAMQDVSWYGVADYFPSDPKKPTRGINIIEFSDDDAETLARRVADFTDDLTSGAAGRLGYTCAQGDAAVKSVYAMRKRAVGLLGNVSGEARPQPFVEDTAVPPEHLAEYIAAFRALLDAHGLEYGMFGHVDAGVLHVRPLLNMRDAADRARVKPISDEVAALTQKYHGLLWGEHGKGLRSEYVPRFFGALYPVLQQVKALFDPHNQLNPGKIATPATLPDASLTGIEDVPMRGAHDQRITPPVWKSFGAAMHCNGNGACFNYNVNDPMCPSWKGTRDRRYSPKGRAQLVKAWLDRQMASGTDISALEREGGLAVVKRFFTRQRRTGADFSHEVYDAMATCLACKSCTRQCPVHVDVPDLRARFLSLYHTRFSRPIKDYLIAGLEPLLIVAGCAPRLYNGLMGNKWAARVARLKFGLVDLPALSTQRFRRACRRLGVRTATLHEMQKLSDEDRARSVVFVPDVFTSQIDTQVVLDAMEAARRLGFRVYVTPPVMTGKPLQVYGFTRLFKFVARRTLRRLQRLADNGITLIGVDPAMTLVFRQEYRHLGDIGVLPEIKLIHEWLHSVTSNYQLSGPFNDGQASRHTLMLHCTEKTSLADSPQKWREIYQRFGLTLDIAETGCCGMSGAFGHEAANRALSREIFSLSWEPCLAGEPQGKFLATGFSCRSQVKRFRHERLMHPVSVIAARLRGAAAKLREFPAAVKG
ncbi:FAD-binding oxidoreductase [Candidatus Kirkpatrickella diaphorinae]|uniref:FAD-binding oxidoreductase n=1 Tax=Candidatus Kirkpatrickella diaphorinae TaxID=2984322 RepID=A0ABY6GM70_9PROT|nr:FAD-binding and (Fe-S)-binding domain-containing protein [Candidatus Kirkpatrickella diaphorinae]UYH52015.1 FAD-binding oxidoreductase [Candidatus Kirkpatrickella diaphorinae]